MQSQETRESNGIAAFLARKVGAGADSGELAETIAATCRGIDDALAPIIGRRGVAALYKRSVHLSSRTYSWLAAGTEEGVATSMDVASLTSLLARQTSADAAAAGTLLLQTFHTLLTTLVGPSLTERLLRSVWAPFLSGTSLDNLS